MVDAGSAHDCWTTSEAALTRGLPEDVREAWERLRETAADFGEQRIYASHKSIMFSRRVCYFFVRPRTKNLEVVIFLGRAIKDPRVKVAGRPSRTKTANVVRIMHRDEVEAPLTDWLREAYDMSEALSAKPAKSAARSARKTGAKTPIRRKRRQKKR